MANEHYIDNTTISRSTTTIIAGNVIKNIYSDTLAVGIRIDGVNTLILRDNKVSVCRSQTDSAGIHVSNTTNVNASFNTVSRTKTGLNLDTVTTSKVWNFTAHNCETCINGKTTGTYYNIVLSSYNDNTTYKTNVGFYIPTGKSATTDYVAYYGLGDLYTTAGTGTFTLGNTSWTDKPLYVDEPNDDLTPDHTSFLVKNGITEPRLYENPSLGGVQSLITDEETAPTDYFYDLIDNSFWDIDNEVAGEVCITRANQSRVLANCERALFQVTKDFYIKTASSLDIFASPFPINSNYLTPSKYKKAVMDLWYSSANACTSTSYERSIGGYNLLPTFIKRTWDYPEYWIIDDSYLDYDNYLMGMDDQKYGIWLDVLGVSTITSEAFNECYGNVQNSISDIAPVRWNCHDEVEPTDFVIFTKWYNDWDLCTLTNMVYNEDEHISIYVVGTQGQILTPEIYVDHISLYDSVELATFDRINSETVSRTMYYRTGTGPGTMGSWVEIARPIGEVLPLDSNPYIQFKFVVDNVLRQIDYEFISLGMHGAYNAPH